MNKQKNLLDERQQQAMDKAGAFTAYVMLGASVLVILSQLLWTGELKAVLGETLVFLTGGIVYLTANIRKGIWDIGGKKRSTFRNLLESILFSGVFSLLYAVVITGKAKPGVNVALVVVCFFIGIAMLCFLVLTLLGKAARHRQEVQEKKYEG